ncbi:FecCD family ABC transporter permease [Rhizobium rhizosphaerae]|uniref:FecCD family ABC transporter permease n=1 Tax=Xaviernesmea rhizosphaerae TaxID=1672749 RepID=UPI00098F5752|nr:iron ABC transporter permease [Xaviernesmea rhizosphaerae]
MASAKGLGSGGTAAWQANRQAGGSQADDGRADDGQAGDRSARARRVLLLLTLLMGGAFLASIMLGVANASVAGVVRLLLGLDQDAALLRDRIIILDIRLPRALTGLLVGAALAVSGALMQGLFRNPLADPALVGVSSGAALGAVSMIVLGGALMPWLPASLSLTALPLAAFLGGLASTLLLYRIATTGQVTSVATMLLAGIALGALSSAATGLLVFIADDRQLRDITFWTLGSLAGASWQKLAISAPVILVALGASGFLARGLNALTLGEAAAFHMGFSVQRLKNGAILCVAAATGAAVATSGAIGFVGIVVPHLLRLVIGPDNRFLLPAAALLGASLLLMADMLSRLVVAPAELPIGIITALAGAPVFLAILMRGRGRLGL